MAKTSTSNAKPMTAALAETHENPLEQLRTRTSEKWRRYPADVLPLWVAEMDVPLASLPAGWGWDFEVDHTAVVADVMTGIGDLG